MRYLKYAALLLLMPFAGCSSEEQPPDPKPLPGNELQLKNLWVRAGNQNSNSAGYGDIQNGTESSDTLLSVWAEGVGRSEVHESYTTEDGLSGMRPAEKLVIPPRETLKLQPGSFHLMLMGLERDLHPGDSLQITFQFASAGSKTLQAPIKE